MDRSQTATMVTTIMQTRMTNKENNSILARPALELQQWTKVALCRIALCQMMVLHWVAVCKVLIKP